jgi:hypothetical protein
MRAVRSVRVKSPSCGGKQGACASETSVIAFSTGFGSVAAGVKLCTLKMREMRPIGASKDCEVNGYTLSAGQFHRKIPDFRKVALICYRVQK